MFKLMKRATGLSAIAAISVQQVHAAVDPGVSSAITGAGADAAVVGGLVLVVLVGIMAFKWIRKAM